MQWHGVEVRARSAALTRCAQQPALSVADIPTRAKQVARLQSEVFDVVIVGGGATGTGAALDAASRGLKVALVERGDFSCGTSSRSTKIVHGGVRYLEKAFWNLDIDQFRMVRKALKERANWFHIAPHIAHWLPIMLPVTTAWWKLPYFYVGAKVYDLVAGWPEKRAYFLTAEKALEAFPMLQSKSLVGAVVYYDGQADDSRMNVALAQTAAALGAVTVNYCDVREVLIEPSTNKASGVRVFDRESRQFYDVKARVVVSACGPFTDSIRQMESDALSLGRRFANELRAKTSRAVQVDEVATIKPIVRPSSGTHVILPDFYSPSSMGLIDPNTSDGRVIFFLPWLDHTICGTTDAPCPVDREPAPTEPEIEWILKEVKHYLGSDLQVRRQDVLSAWTGIRPLVLDPNAKNTEELSRDHIVVVSPADVVIVAGGKWTTYREMAQDAIDAAIRVGGESLAHAGKCDTANLKLLGAARWNANYHIHLIQAYGIDSSVARNLARTYGDQADVVAQLMQANAADAAPLVPHYPFVEAEVRVACRYEYAQSVGDVLGRRLRLAFLNRAAAEAAVPRVIEIMAQEHGWNDKRKAKEFRRAKIFLAAFGGPDVLPSRSFRKATSEEIRAVFARLDTDGSGTIDEFDLRRLGDSLGAPMSVDDIQRAISAMDSDRDGKVSWEEFEHWWYQSAKSEQSKAIVKLASGSDRDEFP